MSRWKIEYSPDAKTNIKDAITYYNKKSKGLGKRFYLAIKKQDEHLEKNPFFQIRYDNTRCLPLEKFPFMIHFEVDEIKKVVYIYAIICTLQNPDDYWIK